MTASSSYRYQCKFTGPNGKQKMYKNKRIDHMTTHLVKIGKISAGLALTEDNFSKYYTVIRQDVNGTQQIRRSRRLIETQLKMTDLAYDEKLNTSRAETEASVLIEKNKLEFHKKNIEILEKKQKDIDAILENCRKERKKLYTSYL